MKNGRLTLLVAGIFLSCSVNNEPNLEGMNTSNLDHYPQKWKLVKMTGSFSNSETTGAAMAWQEFYVLYSDSTFVKSRSRDDVVTQASGVYTFVSLSAEKYLELTYDADNELIGSCTTEPKEFLRLINDKILRSSWQACDGPGLDYQRMTVPHNY